MFHLTEHLVFSPSSFTGAAAAATVATRSWCVYSTSAIAIDSEKHEQSRMELYHTPFVTHIFVYSSLQYYVLRLNRHLCSRIRMCYVFILSLLVYTIHFT